MCNTSKTTKLRIMSNNIWWCDTNTEAWSAIGADCSAEHRAHGFFRTYKELAPDIIGLQECTADMAHFLMTLFAENELPYALLWGRDTPIVYRRDKLELVDSKAFIYPESIPGFEGSFNNAKTKSYCIGAFKEKISGNFLTFATTHLWYKSGNPEMPSYQPYSHEAREYQLGLLMDRMDEFQARYNCPAVIVGDFNAYYSSNVIKAAQKRSYVHAHDISLKLPDETSGMHYCCQDGYNEALREGGFGVSIDHILLRGFGDNAVECFERHKPGYYMALSDHLPVWCDLNIGKE
ncbi:MAG: endonuclease/exonuclease/phosphatase family protein [Clostridia bacterium]|nr:endonuclease/exonuclease/phosphatase family protein [Clostridia bacterium]